MSLISYPRATVHSAHLCQWSTDSFVLLAWVICTSTGWLGVIQRSRKHWGALSPRLCLPACCWRWMAELKAWHRKILLSLSRGAGLSSKHPANVNGNGACDCLQSFGQSLAKAEQRSRVQGAAAVPAGRGLVLSSSPSYSWGAAGHFQTLTTFCCGCSRSLGIFHPHCIQIWSLCSLEMLGLDVGAGLLLLTRVKSAPRSMESVMNFSKQRLSYSCLLCTLSEDSK